jgi:hypothetical protein
MKNADTIIEFIKANPGCTAQEAGTTVPVLDALAEGTGLIKRSGKRHTGKRGKPPVEWSASDVEVAETGHKHNPEVVTLNIEVSGLPEYAVIGLMNKGLSVPDRDFITANGLSGKESEAIKAYKKILDGGVQDEFDTELEEVE